MDIMEELAARGAVLVDKHFVYTSGKHGPHYINMDPAFPDTMLMSDVGDSLSEPFSGVPSNVLTVVGAATGGIPLALITALSHGEINGGVDSYPRAIWADKKGEGFVFERAGFVEQLAGRQVLIVEDMLNSGKTTKQLISLVRAYGGDIIGVSVVVNRGDQTAETLDVPVLKSLADVDFQMFPADDCPMCASREPIVLDIGHGAEYQAVHPDYIGGYVSLLG